MPHSFEKINFSARPNKQIGRKMLRETFRRLSVFGTLNSYRYIGFGSVYFRDFVIFHKDLGINNMISIERAVEKEERFRFNKPFDCIEIHFEESNVVLPRLEWDVRTILWLDYDDRLNSNILADISTFCASAISGSLLVVTVNSHTKPPAKPPETKQLEKFSERIGRERVPIDIKDSDLLGWGTAKVSRRVINNQILEVLHSRNGVRVPGSRFLYQQLFNFHYADDAKMLTVGGILYDEGQAHILGACNFDGLSFIRQNEEPYLIRAPNLTPKELHHLNAQLPIDDPTHLQAPAIPEEDLRRYAEVYRYFPNFVEIET